MVRSKVKKATTAIGKAVTRRGKGKGPVVTSSAKQEGSCPGGVQDVDYTKWLIKSEPDTRMVTLNGKQHDAKYSFDDLKKEKNQTCNWDGVRNYQARGFLRDKMKAGHQAFFYHSNCKTPGIVGICDIVRDGYPDHTAFDKNDLHYDPKSDPDNPRWFQVDVKYKRDLKRLISLDELKGYKSGDLGNMFLLRSSRLSVSPVSDAEWEFILSLENKKDT